MNNGWAILPAADAIFGKKKVTLSDIASFWKSGTVVVMEKPNGMLHFIAGASGHYADIGEMKACYHDQSGKLMGYWKVLDEIRYSVVNGKPVFSCSAQGNIAPVNLKASLAVFK